MEQEGQGMVTVTVRDVTAGDSGGALWSDSVSLAGTLDLGTSGRDLGKCLFTALFAAAPADLVERLRTHPETMELVLLVDDNTADYPWELLVDRGVHPVVVGDATSRDATGGLSTE